MASEPWEVVRQLGETAPFQRLTGEVMLTSSTHRLNVSIKARFVTLWTGKVSMSDEMTELEKAKTDYALLTDDYEELAHDVMALRARIRELEAAIADHNKGCELSCGRSRSAHGVMRTLYRLIKLGKVRG